MKGYDRALTSLLYSYAFARSVSGIRMTYGHLSFYASHFTYLCHPASWMSQRGYYGHSHEHATHGDAYYYWIESDYYYGIDICVNLYPLF